MAAVLDTMEAEYRKFDPADAGMPASLLKFHPDVAFLALHGPGGEDGTMQGFLESLEIPYVGSGVLASSVCMNKLYTKWAFESLGIPTPRWSVIDPYEKNSPTGAALPPFPVVAKPLTEGSSVGIEFVDSEEELHALADKRKTPLLVEERIIGRELTLPVFGDPMDSLPVIEIRPKSEFFDFDAKYTKGMTEYICPAEISSELQELLRHYAGKICRALQLRHMSRIDVMISANPKNQKGVQTLPGIKPPEGLPYFLEVNTIPGMTETSLLPMSARAAGMEFGEVIRRLISMARGA